MRVVDKIRPPNLIILARMAATASTLYPKVTQHVSAVVKTLHTLHHESGSADKTPLEPVPLVGLVKLHGTHADILVYNDDRIILQSKNVSNLTTANDNCGFAAAMTDKTATILDIRDKYIARWTTLNPNTSLDRTCPVLIAGEWIGTTIQKYVAVSQLSRRFVIISVAINNAWIDDSQYPSIEAPGSAIYNISCGGRFTATLYPDDIRRTLAEVEKLAEEVAASCPFAASFGIIGEGEGIVWKPVPSHLNFNPALWFKTKGGRFKPTFAPAPKTLPVDQQEKRDAADAVAKIWCTEERLQQGWDFLKEIGVERDMKGLRRYLKWVQDDVLTEEKAYIEENGFDEVMLKISIAKIARVWYVRSVGLGKE